jgi:predicted HTH domain antitoxin
MEIVSHVSKEQINNLNAFLPLYRQAIENVSTPRKPWRCIYPISIFLQMRITTGEMVEITEVDL